MVCGYEFTTKADQAPTGQGRHMSERATERPERTRMSDVVYEQLQTLLLDGVIQGQPPAVVLLKALANFATAELIVAVLRVPEEGVSIRLM